jgi:uncharacterized protein YbjT (DUF2867 family)
MVLVTGAAGLSGSMVINEFVHQNLPVRALVRSREHRRALDMLPRVELVEGDMLRPDTLGPALEGVERILMISSANPHLVETQCTFIDAASRAGVRHVIKFSGKESNIGFNAKVFRFTRMHEEIERYLESSRLAWTHLRPSQFMQVYLREVPTIVREGAFRLPLDDVRLSPVDLEDVAKVAVVLLRGAGHEGQRYDMTGPEALTMTDIAERITQATGRTVRYVNVSPAERRQALLNAGASPEFADALDEQGAERRRCPESRVYLTTHETFGVRPTSFAEFARRNAVVFRGGSL